MAQSPRNGQNDAHEHRDDGKDDCAQGMIGKRVQDLGAGEDVEADEKDVVGEQHEGGEVIGNSTLAKDVVSKVADISDLWIYHDELVHGQ